MSFDKKWSQLSKEEQKAAKAKHGSRSAWQDARARSQGYQNKVEKTNDKAVVTDSESKAKNMPGAQYGKNGQLIGYSGEAAKVRAAEIAKNNQNAHKVVDPKQATYDKAAKYLQNHPNKGKGGTRDAGFEKILKEGGMNNHMFQQMQNKNRKEQYDKAQDFRKEEARAYSQSRVELQKAKDAVGRRGVYQYQSVRDNHLKDGNLKKYDSLDPNLTYQEKERNALIRTFRDSGYDYNSADILRHMKGGKENKMFTGLYDDYGGYKNWYENHSIYSGENAQAKDHVTNKASRKQGYDFDAQYQLNLGNWKGSQDIIATDEVLRQGQARQQAGQNYRTSEDFANRFGKYDFAKRQ